MAYYKKAKRNRSTRTKKSDKAAELRRLAYKMGQVERGLKNPDSQISASFQRGKEKKYTGKRKPLF